MNFAEAFRAHVVPQIEAMLREQAPEVAAERLDFSDAIAAATRQAARLGFYHLPSHLQAEFDEWMATTLHEEVRRHIPSVMAQWHTEAAKWERWALQISAAHDARAGRELAAGYLVGCLGG